MYNHIILPYGVSLVKKIGAGSPAREALLNVYMLWLLMVKIVKVQVGIYQIRGVLYVI